MKIKKRTMRTSASFSHDTVRLEKISKKSMTQPNQAYSIQELLEKHKMGVMPNVFRAGNYEDNPDIDNPNPLRDPDVDLIDVHQLADEVSTELAAAKRNNEEAARDKEAKRITRLLEERENEVKAQLKEEKFVDAK